MMPRQEKEVSKFSDLRHRAEDSLRHRPAHEVYGSTLSSEEVRRLIHELQVHQAELEMQNDELRRTQVELDNSRNRYEDLYDFAPVGYLTLNDKAIILEANTTAARFLGVEREKLINKPFPLFICPDQTDAYHLHLRQILETQSKQTLEVVLAPKHKARMYAQLESVPVRGENGALQQCRTVIVDITERKKAEEELLTRKAQLDAALASMNDAVFISDVEGNFVEFNEAFATFHRFRNKRECAKTLEEYPEFLDVFMANGELAPLQQWAVPRALRGETAMNAEYSLRRKDTGEAWVGSYSFAPIRDQDGQIVGSVVTGRDITEQKRAEEVLRASEQRYRSLFDNMLEGLAYCKMLFEDGKPEDFVYLDVNQSFERLTNLKDVVGKKVTAVIPNIRESNPELFEIYGRVALSGQPERFEIYVEPLGIWFSLSVYSPEREHFIAVFDNITERKRAEEALKQSEARLHLAQDAAQAGTWEWDLRNGKNFWSDELWALYGLEPHSCEPSYDAWLATVYPNDRAAAEQAVNKAASSGAELNAEWRTNKGRGQRWLMSRGRPLRDANGNVSRYIGIVLDITDRKRAEQLIRESEENHRLLIENLNAGVLVCDPDTTVRLCNKMAAEIVGLGPDELVGKRNSDPDWILLAEDGSPMPFDEYPLNRVLATGQALADVVVGFRRQGIDEPNWVLANAYPAFDERNELIQLVVTFVDISRRKMAEEALRKSEQLLSSDLRALKSLQDIGELYVREGKVEEVFGRIVETAIEFTGAAKGNIQLLDPKKGGLRIVAHRGFEQPFLSFWQDVSSGLGVCGAAFERGERVIVENVAESPLFLNTAALEVQLEAGVKSVQSTPLISRDGSLLGMISTHWTRPHRPDENALRLMDLLARQAADIIERSHHEELLRVNEERLNYVLEGSNEGFWDWNIETGEVQRNERWAEMLGYSFEEIALDVPQWDDLVHPDDRVNAWQSIMNHLEGLTSQHEYEYRMRTKHGEWKWILDRARVVKRNEHGQPTRMAGTHTDITERKKAEEALRMSEERIRAIADSTQDGIVVIDDQGGITYWNPSARRIFGYDALEVMGKDVHALLAPEELRETYLAASRQFAECGEGRVIGRTVELEAIRRGGERFPIELSLARFQMGDSWNAVGIVRDIEERKKSEDQMLKWNSVIQNAKWGIVYSGPDLQSLDFMNPAFAEMHGYAAEELTGRPIVDVFAPDEKVHLPLHIARTHEKGNHTWESKHIRKDGSVFPVLINATAVKDKKGRVLYRAVNVLDMTNQKEAELKLRESEERYRTVADFTYDWEYWINAEGTLLWISPSCERITGYSAQEFLDLPGLIEKIIHPDDRDNAIHHFHLARKIDYDRSYNVDFRIVHRDGTTRWISHVCRPVHDQAGRPLGRRASNRDVTDRKDLEQQFQQAQKMEAVGTLAGGIAHDFNNVLQVALGYSEILLGDDELPEPCKSDLQKINESAKRGADLVQRLLTFSRNTEIKPEPLDLNLRITELRKMLERTLPKMVKIRIVQDAKLAYINADKTQIDQVLMNLAVNARDAMPDGGQLIFETANVTLGQEYVNRHLEARPGPHVLLTVSDTGSGIDKDTLQHIFEPFYTTKGLGEGTGLGLAMVHGIVKHHEGHIRCLSELGKGTTFKIYFPALSSEEHQEETMERSMPRGGSETILLVDDEELIRELGSRILSKAGYKVIAASNGKEALEVYDQHGREIDVVLLDFIMPEMGGKQCLEEILKRAPTAKVVIASGFAANGPTRDTLSAGAKGFVNKPYEMRQVLEVVRQVLDAGTCSDRGEECNESSSTPS